MSGTSDKKAGGTHNYAKQPTVLQTRKAEFERLMETGNYNKEFSYFDKSGGFVLVHNEHNMISEGCMEMETTRDLAKKGYKIYLESEKSYVFRDKKHDGFIYKSPMDIKTVATAGNYTIKGALEKAAGQNVKTVILRQNTQKMTRTYVDSQIDLFKTKSPKVCVKQIERVIVVGSNGHVHVHVL